MGRLTDIERHLPSIKHLLCPISALDDVYENLEDDYQL